MALPPPPITLTASSNTPGNLERNPAADATRGVVRAVAGVRLLLDRRDQHDGAQPLPAAPPGKHRQPGRDHGCSPARPHRPAARRRAAREQLRQQPVGRPVHGHHVPHAGRERVGSVDRQRRGDLLHPGAVGDHAEDHRGHLSGTHRARLGLCAHAAAAHRLAGRLVREPVRAVDPVAAAPEAQGRGRAEHDAGGTAHAGARGRTLHTAEASEHPRQPVRARTDHRRRRDDPTRTGRVARPGIAARTVARRDRHLLSHPAGRLPRRPEQRDRHPACAPGAVAGAPGRPGRSLGHRGAARPTLFRTGRHRAVHPACPFPGTARADRTDRRRIR